MPWEPAAAVDTEDEWTAPPWSQSPGTVEITSGIEYFDASSELPGDGETDRHPARL